MAIPNRYKQLLASVPKGNFYTSDGQVLPYKDAPYELSISMPKSNFTYGIYVNNVFNGTIVTDVSGVAAVSITLSRGRNDIKLVDSETQLESFTYITTRDYAVWLAAYAEILEALDQKVEQISVDSKLDTVSLDMIDEVFGKTVHISNSFAYDLDTYREVLQEVRTAFRCYGGTMMGIGDVVRAITQVSPLIYNRSFGPRWILGRDLLYDSLRKDSFTYYTNSTTTDISGSGSITVVHIDGDVGTGTGDLQLDGLASPPTLEWLAPGTTNYGPPVEITTDGEYELYGQSDFDDVIGAEEPYNIVVGETDALVLNINNLGIIEITLTPGATQSAADICTDVNAALVADDRYGAPFSGTAYTYDALSSGVDRVALTPPVSYVEQSVAIHIGHKEGGLASPDAAQVVFDIPSLRGQLATTASAGGIFLTISPINIDAWPTPTASNPVELLVGYSTYQPPSDAAMNTPVFIQHAEVVEAIAFNKLTGVFTLAAPKQYNHLADTLVLLNGTQTFKRTNDSNAKKITVKVEDVADLPTTVENDAIVVEGTGVPDNWLVTPSLQAYPVSNRKYFDLHLPITIEVGDTLEFDLPSDVLKYKGFNITIDVWAAAADPSNPTPLPTIDSLSFEWTPAVLSPPFPVVGGILNNAENRPLQYKFSTPIPAHAVMGRVRINTTGTAADLITIHKVTAVIPAVHGLFVGHNTIPRGESQIKHGEFLYVWSPDPLSLNESSTLGLDQVKHSSSGLIDKVTPDFVSLEKFNVSEYSGGNPLNVYGAYNEVHFTAGTSVNLELALRSPSRFSYLKPTTVSTITQEVHFALSSPHVANLDIVANQIKDRCLLLEDGIPVTQDNWVFNNATEIELLVPPNGLKYTFEYHPLIRFESDVIDLLADHADRLWFADYNVFLRPDIEPIPLTITTGIAFSQGGIATLADRSNQDKSRSTLVADLGLTKQLISAAEWEFLDASTISISASAYNPDAIYELTYQSLINIPSSSAKATVEIRSASAAVNLPSATYQQIQQNEVFNNFFRYHQMRVTLDNVRDVRDVRVRSLIIKGLNMSTVPILNS